MSPFLAFTLKTDHSKPTVFQFYAFSIAFSNSSVFTAEQCERKAKTEKFYSNGAV